MEVIVLVGGKGTRLRLVITDLPKPMAPVNNKPFLEYLLNELNNQGVKKVILAVGYKANIIIEYFGNQYKNMEIQYSIEKIPLGTGGAIKKALDIASESNIVVVNGDTFSKVNLEKMMKKHLKKESDLTIATKTMKKFDRYGQVLSENDKIVGFKEKQYCEEGNINIGTYILKKDFFKNIKTSESFSFENDIMEKYFSEMNFISYLSDTMFIDIGIPEDYKKSIEIIRRDYEKKS